MSRQISTRVAESQIWTQLYIATQIVYQFYGKGESKNHLDWAGLQLSKKIQIELGNGYLKTHHIDLIQDAKSVTI